MARPKKEEVEKVKEAPKKVDNKEVEDLKKHVKKLEKENSKIKDIEKQMLEMAKMMDIMSKSQPVEVKASEKQHDYLEDTFMIHTRKRVNKEIIRSPLGDVEKKIKIGKPCYVDMDELKKLVKNEKTRNKLELNRIYFEDESLYKKLRIKKKFDLSDEFLVDLFKKDNFAEIKAQLDEFTNKRRSNSMVHMLWFIIVDLITNGELANMNYTVRKEVEDYFNFKIADAQMLVSRVKEII